MNTKIIFLSALLVLVLLSASCAEDNDSESQTGDMPQQGGQGLENISGEGKLCGDGTCDEAEEESGFCTIDCD